MDNFREIDFWSLKMIEKKFIENPRLEKIGYLDELRLEVLETPHVTEEI